MIISYYLRRRLASGKGRPTVTLGSEFHNVVRKHILGKAADFLSASSAV